MGQLANKSTVAASAKHLILLGFGEWGTGNREWGGVAKKISKPWNSDALPRRFAPSRCFCHRVLPQRSPHSPFVLFVFFVAKTKPHLKSLTESEKNAELSSENFSS